MPTSNIHTYIYIYIYIYIYMCVCVCVIKWINISNVINYIMWRLINRINRKLHLAVKLPPKDYLKLFCVKLESIKKTLQIVALDRHILFDLAFNLLRLCYSSLTNYGK